MTVAMRRCFAHFNRSAKTSNILIGRIYHGAMIEKFSPRNLRVLIAVQEGGRVASAATVLLRAPSAVSRSVQELELA